MNKTFEEARAMSVALNARVDATGKVLQQFPKGPMGLTPDDVRATDAWKAAKREFDLAFSHLRSFNAIYVKKFKKELAAERAARYEQRREVAAMRNQM